MAAKRGSRTKRAESEKPESSDLQEAAAVSESPAAFSGAEAAPVPKPSVAGPPRIDIATFWRMQHAAAEMRAAKSAAETARFKKLYVLALLDPKGRVLEAEKELDKARKSVETHENTYLNLKKYLESRIGQPLANVAIDPDTGIVTTQPK